MPETRHVTVRIIEESASPVVVTNPLYPTVITSEQLADFIKNNQAELSYVKELLKNRVIKNIQLPHHCENNRVSYEEAGKEPVILKHSYRVLHGRFLVKLFREDLL